MLQGLVVCVFGAFLAVTGDAASAGPGACDYRTIDIDQFGKKPFVNPPEIKPSNHVLSTTLQVLYSDPARISLAGCPLHLRTYNGQLVGPTLRVRPGDTMDIALANELPVESPDQIARNFEQEAKNAHLGQFPASYNTTNLHTHGLHVSPSGNSDNVLLMILPGTTFPYEIKVPSNHPSGTFWYHAHAHGSTSIQVGSGMAGALILDDDPAKIPPALAAANTNEKVMVLQTLLYNTKGELNQITALFPGGACAGEDQTWECSKRVVTINGEITPVITMRPGEVQRWRLIDSAFRESFDLRLEGHALNEIALDGLYLGRVDSWPAGQTVSLQPGYRSDVLVKASMTPGTYNLVNGALSATKALRAVAQPEQVIAILKVQGEPMDMKLPTSAEMAALAPFPGTDLRKTAIGVQQLTFKLGQDNASGTKQRNYFQVNFEAFDHERVRKVVLNQTDQWTLTTTGDPTSVANGIPPLPHVFHIHVNPFQVIRRDPSGNDELVWKDTILVPPTGADGKGPPPQVNIWTHYTDYVGQFVLHCHILDHEDLGMMEVVEVVEPEAVNMRFRMNMHSH